MIREDIIRMAREAGFDCAPDGHIYNDGTIDSSPLDENIERFATLVAAAEREALEKQRDELLSAIERAKYWMAGTEAKRILDAAIASVKDGAA